MCDISIWNHNIIIWWFISFWMIAGWSRVGGDYTLNYYRARRGRSCTLSEWSFRDCGIQFPFQWHITKVDNFCTFSRRTKNKIVQFFVNSPHSSLLLVLVFLSFNEYGKSVCQMTVPWLIISVTTPFWRWSLHIMYCPLFTTFTSNRLNVNQKRACCTVTIADTQIAQEMRLVF